MVVQVRILSLDMTPEAFRPETGNIAFDIIESQQPIGRIWRNENKWHIVMYVTPERYPKRTEVPLGIYNRIDLALVDFTYATGAVW